MASLLVYKPPVIGLSLPKQPRVLGWHPRPQRYSWVRLTYQRPQTGGKPTEGVKITHGRQQHSGTTNAAISKRVNQFVRTKLASPVDDFIYQFDASREYNSEPHLASIVAPVMWINSADDFINPPELDIAQQLADRMPHATFILIPAPMQTYGHGTHTHAAVWESYLVKLLKDSEGK